MEKNHKIIVMGLIVVIIALIVAIAYTMVGDNLSIGENGTVPEGMHIYDFDSVFKMAVPKNSVFLKDWNTSMGEFGQGTSYFDKNNEFCVYYVYSPLMTKEFVNYIISLENASGNSTFEFDGDLVIFHNLKENGKVGDNVEDSNFTDGIFIHRGHEFVSISGNDADAVRKMAETIKFYE